MPGELQFVNKVASELFIAVTVVKPKKEEKMHAAGCDAEDYGFASAPEEQG